VQVTEARPHSLRGRLHPAVTPNAIKPPGEFAAARA
jgi:hypothetical protein